MTRVSNFWPVNSNGEIIIQAGTGSTTITGYLPQDQIPTDDVTGLPLLKISENNNISGISIPDGWGSNWKAALANAKAGTGLARLAMVGDSLTAGQWSSNLDAKNLAGLLRTSLQSVYGDGGSGFKGVYDTSLGLNNAGYVSTVAASSLIALSGTWVVPTGVADGPGANLAQCNSDGGTATYTVRGTTVETFVLQVTTGANYSVTIDGNVNGPYSSSGVNGIQRRTFTGLSAGNHTVVVTAINGSSAGLFLCGVRGVNSSGVVVDKYGRGGYPSRAFKNGTNFTFVKSDGTSIGGANNGTYAPAGSWSGGAANPADLIIIGFGLNDCRPSSPQTPDQYLANLRDYLDDARDGTGMVGAVDIMIVMQHAGINSWQDASTKYYALYCERAADLARAYGAAFVDFWTLGKNSYNWMLSKNYMGNQNSAGAAGTDSVHLSDAGFQWQHDTIKPLVSL